MDQLKGFMDSNKDRFLNELIEFLKIPSVSADPKYKDEVIKAANWVADNLHNAGAENVEVIETDGHPIVYGDKIVNEHLPTVLVYGHYDVQPPDPIELWNSPPFEPIIKDDKIYARGACDDKGQLFMHIKAYESMQAENVIPCNVKFMLEGEEEVGSENLEAFCTANQEKLACDVILISDTSIIANDVPSITTGLRGICYMEVEVEGPNRDLHSGTFGGGVVNPINVLCKMIADMQDENKHITIEGFYDKVIEVSAEEREAMNEAPFDLEEYKKDLGVKAVDGEKGYTTLERTSIRPTLDVNGIWGGYTGEGSKTVLPSKAYAKISMRLVPNQDPQRIEKLFEDHFKRHAPDSVQVKVTAHHGGHPVITPLESIEYKAAAKAMEHTFGKQPIPQRAGGSIPIVALFKNVLKANSILLGFGLDSDDIHSPNEKYGLFNFYKGIETIPYFYKYYMELQA